MKLSGNTILITGGTSGIGLELTRQLHRDNTVIVTGRDLEKLSQAGATLGGGVRCIQSDVSDPAAIVALFEKVTREFPTLNVLINNAGIMREEKLAEPEIDLTDSEAIIATNLLGPIRLTAALLPLLRQQGHSTVVNVSSGLAFVPLTTTPSY